MSRIIFIPQLPTHLRYQQWFYTQFPIEFRRRGFDVVTVGEKYIYENRDKWLSEKDMFSPINEAINFELYQIQEFLNMKLYDDDILLMMDISFPGFFNNVFYHKRCSKQFVFCHATSINKYDYFESVKTPKFMNETSHTYLFNKVFVGSNYHAKKLNWPNTVVTYLPFAPFPGIENKEKTIDIVSASRPSKQKVDFELEKFIEEVSGIKIQRFNAETWDEYFSILSSSKILLITSHEDTFGYQIVDAVINNCIPLARNSFAYPELLSRDYLYDDKRELMNKIDYILNADFDLVPKVDVPKLLCEDQMKKFYDKLIVEMTE